MLRRLGGASLLILLAWSGVAQALGLGDIRLQSALNEPFRAEIELLSATPEELEGLTVRVASAETFERYGIGRPSFLGDFRFEVSALPGDRGVVRVTSREPVTEPFVTFLAEADWPGGRLLREYTVLLDPPTFASEAAGTEASVQTPAAPVERPADSGSIRREATPAPAPAPAPRQAAPARSAPSIASGETYRVQRNDTLWEIAQRVRPDPDLTTNQVMVGLYDANPEAFDGNINRLRAGALLRVPAEDSFYGINRAEAIAEVSRQNEAWRSGTGSLRLVPPPEDSGEATAAEAPAVPVAETGTGTSAAADAGGERMQRLEQELAERDRLLAVKDREIAALREQLAAAEREAAAAPAQEAPAEPEPAAPGVDLEAEDEEPVFAEPEAGEEAVTEAPAEEAEPERQVTTPPAVTTRQADDGGFMGTVKGLFASIWTWVGLGVVLIALALAALARRRGEEAEESTGTWQGLDEDEFDIGGDTESIPVPPTEPDDSIVVVEKEEEEPPPAAGAIGGAAAGTAAGAAAEAVTERRAEPAADFEAATEGAETDTSASGMYSLDDTFSSETAVNLDQADPVAEADFHMAYGLYDQAADLMRSAIEADPERVDLKAKLAEVYFVWGNKDAFVDAAANLHDALGDGDGDGEWDKIVIMGRQIAPDNALFSEGPSAGGAAVDVSFDEEGGAAELDMDFGADEDEGDLDMTFGDEDVEEAGESELTDASADLDFEFGEETEEDDTGRSATRQMPTADIEAGAREIRGESEESEESGGTAEMPAAAADVDVDLGAETGEYEYAETRETPALSADETSRMAPPEAEDGALTPEETAEIDLDDLGLDFGDLDEATEESIDDLVRSEEERQAIAREEPDQSAETPPIEDDEATRLGSGAGEEEAAESVEVLPEDEATLIAAPGEAADEAVEESAADEDEDLTGMTGRMPVIDEAELADDREDPDREDLDEAPRRSDADDADDVDRESLASDETMEQPAAELESAADVFDEEELDSMLDFDLGEEAAEDDGSDTAILPEEGPADGRTQTEVGTKLDLARAYLDMGDPDGARSILQEVLDEGDEAQRQEANNLLDALPD